MSREGRTGTMLAGAGLTVGSIFVMQSGATDNDHNGVNDTALDDNWGAYFAGSAMMIAGIGVLVAGLTSTEEPAPDRTVTYLPSAASMPMTPAPIAAEPAVGAPEQVVEIEKVPVVALPELPATADVLRLAKQVRSASTHGRCDAAWIMWTDLQRLDAAYARALRDGPVMTGCAI